MPKKRSDIPARVGRQLRLLREERGYTQDTVGERAGFTGKYVSEIERGLRDPSLTTLERLAEQGVGRPLGDLLVAVTPGRGANAVTADERRGKVERAAQALTGRILELPPDVAASVLRLMQGIVDLARRG